MRRDEILGKLRERIVRFAASHGSGDAAEDLAQEVLLLLHEKYAATYAKVVAALRNLFKVKADSPTLINFLALVKWVDPDSAVKLAKDIGMTAP